MSSSETISSLLSDPNYDHRICGMHSAVAQMIRKEHKEKTDQQDEAGAYTTLATNLKRRLHSVYPDITVGVLVGSAFKSYYLNADRDDLVIVNFLSDTLDIDSKQMTFVHRSFPPERLEKIFAILYKHNFMLA
eukprot:TRINITY_DN3899_c0_g1_i3.p1 TRINITY_DN3899_c0_g1~~TRINITY_DN3899_c0_g1_i3.p1  ORF type:complete len:141 (-),score=23.42 TRINITY_DN3899_c0_g1_i3:115-513(-)